MNYLLDTHTFLWSLFDSRKLTKKSREIIVTPVNRIYVSRCYRAVRGPGQITTPQRLTLFKKGDAVDT